MANNEDVRKRVKAIIHDVIDTVDHHVSVPVPNVPKDYAGRPQYSVTEVANGIMIAALGYGDALAAKQLMDLWAEAIFGGKANVHCAEDNRWLFVNYVDLAMTQPLEGYKRLSAMVSQR